MTLNPTRPNVPHIILVSPSPKVQAFSLNGQLFLSYRWVWDKCTEWPQKWPWTYKVKSWYIYNYSPRVSNFPPFCSTTSRFRDTGNFDKCTEWPQNDLEHYKVKLPHNVLLISTSHTFHSFFDLQPAIFKLQAILRQVQRMTPKWPWTIQGQITPYM